MDLLFSNLKGKLAVFLGDFNVSSGTVELAQCFTEALRKLKKAQTFVCENPLVGVILGPVILTALIPVFLSVTFILGPFLFVLGAAAGLVGAMLVLLSPFLLGILAPILISAGMMIAFLYTTYYITSAVIRYFRRSAEQVTSLSSCLHQELCYKIVERLSQVANCIGYEVGMKQDLNAVCAKESRSSDELEEIEPDYRDREDKLYDALVRKEYKEGDTF